MKKSVFAILLAVLAAISAAALGESLFVDNRETDKVYPERLNMRSEPSKNGAITGLYYSGTKVELLETENEEYVKVSVGGVEGYMASEFLITENEAEQRYGKDGSFGEGRIAEVDLTGMWIQEIPLLERMDAQAQTMASLETGTAVGLLGVLDTWAYITVQTQAGEVLGYVPLDMLTDVAERKVCIIAGEKADSSTILYDAPNNKAKEIMRLKNGTPCFNLFGRREGEWRRVRVGGVSGWIKYTQTANLQLLGDEPRSSVPYYPLLMQAKGDTLMYETIDGGAYITLGRDMQVEVLAECGEYAYARTLEGGAGAYDRGDFGFVRLDNLALSQAGTTVGVAQVDDGDLPLILYEEPDQSAQMLGALCSGAQIRILDYTQTDYVKVALNGISGYILKDGVRILTKTNEDITEKIPQRAVLLSDVTLLDKPNAKAKGGAVIAKGSRVYMLGRLGSWAYVQYAASPGLTVGDDSLDHTGFVPLSQLNAPASTTRLTAFANTDKVNLRDQASSHDGAIIGRARTGERLRIADYGTEWTMVETPDGKRGYMMTKYLDFE